MGGDTRADTDSIQNLLYVCGSGNCNGCHGHLETNREESYTLGLLVRRTVGDIAAVPVRLHHGWCLLNPDGQYTSL